MIVMTPADEDECRQMLYTAYLQNGPTAVRYPRGKGTGVEPQREMVAIEVGKAKSLRQGQGRVAILLFGSLLETAQGAADSLDATLVNMRFVKPIDESMIVEVARSHDLIVTLEDNSIQGGAGSAVSEVLARLDLKVSVLHLGIPDSYIEHAEREGQLSEIGLSVDGVLTKIAEFESDQYTSQQSPKQVGL